jgi:hypothetical protein
MRTNPDGIFSKCHSFEGGYGPKCVKDLVTSKRVDINYCQSIINSVVAGICINAVAIENKDFLLCDTVKYVIDKNKEWDNATKQKFYESDSDICRLQYVKNFKDRNVCERMYSRGYKHLCYQAIDGIPEQHIFTCDDGSKLIQSFMRDERFLRTIIIDQKTGRTQPTEDYLIESSGTITGPVYQKGYTKSTPVDLSKCVLPNGTNFIDFSSSPEGKKLYNGR